MTATVIGRRLWGGERDDDGHRTWNVESYVRTTTVIDGPAVVMQCPGLPQIGDTWNFGNDVDIWAFCYPSMKVEPLDQKGGEPFYDWKVGQKFSTKPMKRCNTTQIEDPLSEPMKLSGTFTKYTKETAYDMYGNFIQSSSREQIHGPGVEFDFNRPTVRIEQNVPTLGLNIFSPMVDTVNDSALWGLPKRCVKLSNVAWERKLWGICTYYYTRSFDFDIDFNTFDRNLIDEGNKCLYGEWAKASTDPALTTYRNGVPLPTGSLWKLLPIDGAPPDRNNPQHYMKYQDKTGNISRVVLNGMGEPCSGGLALNQQLWTSTTFYTRGSVRQNGSNMYQVTGGVTTPQGGVSASSGGPTGTGGSITDNTVIWKYLYPVGTSNETPGNIFVQYYPESNLLLLGIPTSL